MTVWVKITLLVFTLSIFCQAENCDESKIAQRSDQIYYSPSYGHYKRNMRCMIHFKAEHADDYIELNFVLTDMEAPLPDCADKVVVHNGRTESDTVLEEVCGSRRLLTSSSGRHILLVFMTDAYERKPYSGFVIKYKSIKRGDDSSSGLSDGMIALLVLPIVLLYFIVGMVIYKRCKNYRQIRHNLAATGHTPEDLRMALVTMMDQVRRGPLTVPTSQQGGAGNNAQAGTVHTPQEIKLAAANMLTQVGQGPITIGQDPLQDCLLQHMNQNAAKRAIKGIKPNRGRVRHPAGDIHGHQVHQDDFPLNPQDPSATPFLNGDGHHHLHYASYPGINGINSNNNVLANNNTAANLNYQGANGYPSPESIPYSADPSGIYYAGDIDEYGNLHAPQQNTVYSPYGPPPPPPSASSSSPAHAALYLNHRPILEDDRLSQRSGSAYHGGGSGRNSPRDPQSGHRSRTSSAGRRSPHHHHHPAPTQGGSEPHVLTYYGLIDGQVASRDETEHGDVNNELLAAPPSYEEVTASGRLTPRNV